MKIIKKIKTIIADLQDLESFALKYSQYISGIVLMIAILGLIILTTGG